jgi:hypothetical protein
MKKYIKKAIKIFLSDTALSQYQAYASLIKNRESYLYLTGWMQSLNAGKPINAQGNPVPWMNYSIVRLLEERLSGNLTLFEYGSGYSTFFYANKVKKVTSVEYDKEWYDKIKAQIPENVNLIFQKNDINGNYCRTINSTENQYDVVIVDGRDRVNCVKQSIQCLSKKGLILLDDSQRVKYQEGIEFAKTNGFKALNFEGLKATGYGIDRTTILYRDDNCFGI